MRSTHTRAAVLAHARGPISVESLHFAEPAAGEVLQGALGDYALAPASALIRAPCKKRVPR